MRRTIAVLTLALSSGALAQDAGTPSGAPPLPPPPAEEIKRVLDYQENGKERGPALLDVLPCLKVDTEKGSPTQFRCVEPVAAPVKKGTTVFAWLQWLCPKDGKYEDLQLQFLHEGQVRTTIDLVVAGVGRTRAWRGAAANKVGRWTMKVTRGAQELGSATFDVTP